MRLLLSLTFSFTAATIAASFAADLPTRKAPPPLAAPVAYNWTGFYAGVNVGGGWSHDGGAEYCIDPFGALNGATCQVLPPGASGHVNGSGVLGGAQAGYNWQYGQTVFGFETDFQGSGISGSSSVAGPFGFAGGGAPALPAGTFTASESLDWFGTVRGRVGYLVMDRALLYATGGLAYGQVTAATDFTAPNVGASYIGRRSSTEIGWTIGGGVEYALTQNISAKLEGLYYNLGKETVVGAETPLIFAPNGYQHNKAFDTDGGLIRVGLNYKFGTW
jgi:outer membrane immunogenic protein